MGALSGIFDFQGGLMWNGSNGLGAEEMMNAEQRNAVLARIAEGRARERTVAGHLSSLPAWATAPYADDQAAFNAAQKAAQSAEPTVAALEQRLTVEQGPIWRSMTPQEESALANWTQNVAEMADLTEKHFPTEIAKELRILALVAIGVGALFAPLLWTKDEDGRVAGPVLPIRPPVIPVGRRPAPAPPVAMPPSARPAQGTLPFRTFVPPPRPGAPAGAPAGASPVLRPIVQSFPAGMPVPPPGAPPAPRFARPLTAPTGTFTYPPQRFSR